MSRPDESNHGTRLAPRRIRVARHPRIIRSGHARGGVGDRRSPPLRPSHRRTADGEWNRQHAVVHLGEARRHFNHSGGLGGVIFS
jgi:hypothetical protein